MEKLTIQQQLAIIKEVESQYSKFLEEDFDNKVFLKCHDNFAKTLHIQSIQIFNQNEPRGGGKIKFSIAIPTYKRLDSLRRSILSAINQDFKEYYEIIVVENVDDFTIVTPTQTMLETEFRGKLTYYKNESNLGMFGNWNRCLTLAKGEWVCLLHSDDEILPNYLSEMKHMINHPQYSKAALIGCLENISPSKPITTIIRDNLIDLILKNSDVDDCRYQGIIKQIPPNAILHHKKRCINLGGYNQDEYPSGDTLFHTRAFLYEKIYIYKKLLQNKDIEISEGLRPKTLLYYFFISLPLFQLFQPKFYGRILSYRRLISLHNALSNYPILHQYTKKIILQKKLKPKLPLFLSTFISAYYLFKTLILSFCSKLKTLLGFYHPKN
ncbi:glycosyltransferase family 2 protein [Helicobacter anatolicus]|uniref:glycosyltransferase family 2 protein n=1 Tax=Helicobacter anatolicus TaxID=2905874 RepID=UPI001E5D8568|nr:glycosyltransferase family 2 protein [Helicobacter anatolicus]MCE3037991.1 glycosyltransferase family 2 protein [Helicobacter anatolicus]